MIPTNTIIRQVQRAAKFDEYGAPQFDVVFENVPCWVTKATRVQRTADGDFRQVDGRLTVDGRWGLRVGDRVTTRNFPSETYDLLTVTESPDISGRIMQREFTLQRIAVEGVRP